VRLTQIGLGKTLMKAQEAQGFDFKKLSQGKGLTEFGGPS
jgi:hypothetical protein